MSAWIFTIVDGLLTGIGLYALVRLRMYLGPIAGRKLGSWGRVAVWILLIGAMVVLAELDLTWLRDRLEDTDATGTRWHYEGVYALVLLAVGFTLVRWQVLRRTSAHCGQPTARENEQTKSVRRRR